MSYLLGIGLATEDLCVPLDRFPHPDTKIEISDIREEGGGPAATALVAASRMGASGRLLGALGDDPRGARIRHGLEADGVDVGAVRIRPGRRSPLSVILVERDGGSRTVLWDRGDAEPMEAHEIPGGLVEGAEALLVDGHQPGAQHEAVRRARAAGVPVVLDAGSLRAATRQLLCQVDHAVVSEQFALEACGGTGLEALRALRAAGPRVAVITLGKRGCIGIEDGQPVSVPAYPVQAVDTNGAGDVFHGAYLVGLCRGLDLDARLRLAAAAAALKCQEPGPRRGIPGIEAARRLAGLEGDRS